jgi:general secretion pathway protein F
MPEFDVAIHQPGSAPRRARVTAASAQQVAAALGVAPGQLLSVQAASGAAAAAPVARAGAGRPPLSLRLLSQETAVLLDAGIPLLEALTTLQQKETRADAERCLAALCEALREGRTLSDALAAQPQAFDALFIAIVRANESSGSLAAALREHARYRAWAERLRDRLTGALIYPALLLLAGGAVVLFLLLFVMPRFAGVFEGDAAALPWASRLLFSVGTAWADRPLLAVALALSPLLLVVLASRQPALRAALQVQAWRLPGLGPQLHTLALTTTYRAMGMLMAAGVPVPTALALVQGVVAAPLRAALGRATQGVHEGLRLSDALEQQALATPVARRMLRVGEQSGELAQMLTRTAEFHDEEIERLADWIARALTPLLMLAMGVVVGGIVVLMYLPIFQMMEQVQ